MASHSVTEISKQLEKLRKVLAVARQYGTPDHGSKLAVESMLNEEQRLLAELKAAETTAAQAPKEIELIVSH